MSKGRGNPEYLRIFTLTKNNELFCLGLCVFNTLFDWWDVIIIRAMKVMLVKMVSWT